MKTDNLAAKLARDFPKFKFEKSKIAHWSPAGKIISYTDNDAQLLHELGHALLDHTDFTQDIELIHLERDAWEKARKLAPEYGVKITDEVVETALDDYRDWLHARGLCPKCGQTGIQSRADLAYSCLNCDARWTANDARACGLKRRLIKKPPQD
jgi:NADH pyrophosphatase NudC (nudix superfamily)